MATADQQEIRRELSAERDRLAAAVDELRDEIGEATRVREKLQSKLPLAAGAAFALGFVKAGGIGATARLVARRSREADEKVEVGRFRLVRR
jgi:predicted  nucleic acid-binding Zn-ribbon protein